MKTRIGVESRKKENNKNKREKREIGKCGSRSAS